MKQSTLFAILTLTILATVTLAVVGNKTQNVYSASNPNIEAREVREERRAARQAAMERQIDTLINSRIYQFNPETMQALPAGAMLSFANPNFTLGIWGSHADVYLPYLAGVVAPLRRTILNYTIDNLENYTTTKTDEGWLITFESQLFSPAKYTFSIDVNTKFGGATLTLSNPWQNTVQYSGTISKFY